MANQLDPDDLVLLRHCPMTFVQGRIRKPGFQSDDMKRVKRLWSAGYIGGEVSSDGKALTINLKDKGRAALQAAGR